MANDIIVKLRLAAEDFARGARQGFDQFEREAEKAGGQGAEAMSRGFSRRSAALVAAVGAAGVAAVKAVQDSLALAKDLDATSKQLGIGVEALQQWRFAATRAGVSSSEFDSNVGKLTQRIGEAAGGSRKAQQAFVDLDVGFSTASGSARRTDAVLLDLVKRLEGVENPAERARLGTALLGEEFGKLEPLLQDGAAGFNAATAELEAFGGVLSRDEIQNLQETNAKIEQMKTVLSIRIASTVAENSEAIVSLTNVLLNLAAAAVKAAGEYLAFKRAQEGAEAERRQLPDNLSPAQREAAERAILRRNGLREEEIIAFGGVATFKRVVRIKRTRSSNTTGRRESLDGFSGGGSGFADDAVAPRVTASVGSAARRSTARSTQEDREAKAALRNEEQLREALERTLQLQRDSAEVERVRAAEGDEAAAAKEAELSFLQQFPQAQFQTVEALGQALGMSEKMIAARKEELALIIKQGDEAQANAVDLAARQAQAEADRKKAQDDAAADQEAKRQADALERAHEDAIRDVADLYEDLFTGGIGRVWDHFRDEGLRVVADVAAQFTLALLAGNDTGSLNAALGEALGRRPLGSIFGGGRARPANDNGNPGQVPAGATFDEAFRDFQKGPAFAGAEQAVPQSSLLGQAGVAIAAASVASLLGGGKSGQIGGQVGSIAGQLLPVPLPGPLKALAGAVLGQLLGGAIGGTPKGTVTLGGVGGGLGITGSAGKSRLVGQATGLGGNVTDTLAQLAAALGADINGGAASLSLGLRGDNIRIDPSGRGATKKGKGAIDFGQDSEAAIAFAIRDLISDGVLTGISAASKRLLTSGGDIEKQIEKAVLIESVPRLLKERLDPLGAAMDTLFDKFKQLADAMREGGASLEQIAQARDLFELEKADAIAQIGAASAGLKDFLLSLNAGSNSPLSLRQQRTAAEEQLAPFLAQIEAAQAARAEVDRLRAAGAGAEEIAAAENAARAAAGRIDQSGFADASQLLLGISRQANASTQGFFGDFDRIRALTGQAIGLVDSSASAADTRDPFAELTARNTSDMANMLADQTRLLQAINDNLTSLGGSGIDRGFLIERRLFA